MRAVSEDAPVSEPGPSTAPGGDELLASGPKKDRKRSSIAILKRAHTVNLDDLKPDHDGDGKVSAFEKEVWKRLQAVDKDGDGKVSVDELYAIVAEATRKKTKLRLYRRMFIGASLFAVLLVVAISAMTALILAAFKDTRAAQASVLADDEGRVMQTVEASTPLPLVAAPVLRKDQLLSIKTLSVKTADPEQPDREMKASFAIASVHWYNLTAVWFETETHDEIRVWNGEATLVTADGVVLPLCEADVTCSAFTVDDVEVAEAVVEQAKEALIGAGFEDVAASIARRRLQVSECDEVNEFIRAARPPPPAPGFPPNEPDDAPQHPPPSPNPPTPLHPPPSPPAPPPVVMTAVSWGEAGDGTGGGDVDQPGAQVTAVDANEFAFAAITQGGGVIAWGDAQYGGDIHPPTAAELHDIVGLYHTTGAFAAHRRDKSVVAWGDPRYGGDAKRVVPGVSKVYSNDVAFAAVLEAGGVAAWGAAGAGGEVPYATARRLAVGTVENVYSNEFAFVARLADGTIDAWGYGSHGGTIPTAAQAAVDGYKVCCVFSTRSAFAARTVGGALTAWGEPGAGGNTTAVGELLEWPKDVVINIDSTDYAFAAVLDDGRVIAWGDANAGGSIPDGLLNGAGKIVELESSGMAFAARTEGGGVLAWGSPFAGGGGPLASEMAGKSVVDIVATEFAFAALTADGAIVAWGDENAGGALPAHIVDKLITTRAVKLYATEVAFAALLEDRTVVTWGDERGGGDSTKVAASLYPVNDVIASGSAFTAVLCADANNCDMPFTG